MHRRSALPGRWVRIGAAVRPPPPHAFAARWGNRRHLSTMFGSRKLFKKAEECAEYASEVVRMGGGTPVFPSSTAFALPTPSTTSLHTSPVVCPMRAASPWSQSCARTLLLVGPRGKDCPVGCVPCERARRLRLLVECVVLFVYTAVHLLPRPQIWVAALSAPCVPAPGFGGKCRLRVLRSAPTHISLSHPTT